MTEEIKSTKLSAIGFIAMAMGFLGTIISVFGSIGSLIELSQPDFLKQMIIGLTGCFFVWTATLILNHKISRRREEQL